MQNESSYDAPKRLKNLATTLFLNLPLHASQNRQLFKEETNPRMDEADFKDLVFEPD